MEAGIFPRGEFWRFSQNRPTTRVSRTPQKPRTGSSSNGGIAEKTSFRRKILGRRMSPLYLFRFCPYGLSSLKFSSRGSLVSLVRGLVGLKEERGNLLTSPLETAPRRSTPSPRCHLLPRCLGQGQGLQRKRGLGYS